MSWDDSDNDEDDMFGADEPVNTGGNNWDDEESASAGDWDAESEDETKEEKKAAPSPSKPDSNKPKKKSRKQMLAEREAKEVAEKLARARIDSSLKNMTEEQRAAYEHKKKRQQERNDLEVAGDLFGGCDMVEVEDESGFMAPDPIADLANHPAYAPVVVEKELKLDSKKDFENYARDCVNEMTERNCRPKDIGTFVRVVMQEGTKELTVEQVTALKNSLNLIHKEKIKARTKANKKKKNKKPTANVGHGDYYDSTYDNAGDFDFL